MIITLANENLNLFNLLKNGPTLNKIKQGKILDSQEQAYMKLNYASEFGFRINEKGFFDKDLNKIANIPQSYDINVKSIRAIAKEFTKQDKTYVIDLPYLLNNYYSVLKAINLEFFQEDNDFLSRDIISQFSSAFSTHNGEFLGQISRIYDKQEEISSALNNISNLNTLMLDHKIIHFYFDKAINDTSSNEILKPYLNKYAQISKSGLLINFIYHDIKTKNDDGLNVFTKALNLEASSCENLQKILKGEMDIKAYIKQNNEQSMSFDFYLYVKGVDKKTSTKDKLATHFEQYKNQEKMHLKESTKLSSTFELYIEQNSNDFTLLKKEYEKTQDVKRLKKANHVRFNSMQTFLAHRQKQVNLNKILLSYSSVMI